MTARRLLFLLALAASAPASAAADPDRYMPTRLLAETSEPRPGSTVLVGFRMEPKPGWHGYWSNPGDAGIVPTVRWTGPAGVGFGPLLHPAPTLISDGGIDSYVHDGPHVLLARMTVPESIKAGTAIPVKAKLNWAACTATQCVPLSATFSLDLVAGKGIKGPDSQILRSARAKLPRPVGEGSFTADKQNVELRLPAEARLDPKRTRFFPDSNDQFETARGRASRGESGIVISGPTKAGALSRLSGVATDGRSAYRIAFVRGPATSATDAGKDETAEIANETEVAEPVERASADPAEPALIREETGPAESPRDGGLHWLAVAAAAIVLTGLAAFALARKRRL